MGLMADDLWDISREAQPNSTLIGEDIRSRSNYPSTSTRRIALTTWLWWTCLSPRGAKPNKDLSPYGSYRWYGATRPSHPVFESSALKLPGLTPSGGRHLTLWTLWRRLGANGIDSQ